jgi:hypothetical protein
MLGTFQLFLKYFELLLFSQSHQQQPNGKRYSPSFFTNLKKEMLAKQGYKCPRCHKKLGVGYHFSNIKPWAEGGKTTVRTPNISK